MADAESRASCVLRVACDTGPKQFAWGALGILTLILSLAAGAYFSRYVDETVVPGVNATMCDLDPGGFDPGQRHALQVVVILGAILSLLGSSFIMFSYFWFHDLQTFPYKLIMFLSLADWFASVEYLLAIQDVGVTTQNADCYEDNFMCFMSAGMSQFFDMASFFWVACISYNIYQVLVKRRGADVVKFEKYYHMVCWGVPAFFTIIVTLTGSLGDAGNWCWIKRENQIERWLCYYVVLIIVMIVICVQYYRINQQLKTQGASHQRAIQARMILYIVVFLFIRFWSVLNRTVEALAGNHGVFVLTFMHSLFSPVQGFANALVYGLNKKIMNHYAALCCCNRDAREFVRDGSSAAEDMNPNPASEGGASGRDKAGSGMSSLNVEEGSQGI